MYLLKVILKKIVALLFQSLHESMRLAVTGAELFAGVAAAYPAALTVVPPVNVIQALSILKKSSACAEKSLLKLKIIKN